MLQSKKKIRVLECIRQGQIGGGESHLLSLVENIDKNIFEPIVLSFTDGPMIQRLRDLSISTYIIHSENPFDISKWRRVKKLMINEKINLVHAHGTRANSNILWAAKRLKIPVIYTIHGWSFHDDQNYLVKKIRIFSEKVLTGKSTVNIAVSESNKQTGDKYIKGFNSVVINNGIDQIKFNPQGNFTDVRKELNISGNTILLLFIARFTAHKQPLTLIKSFALALNKLPGMKLLMVGDGDEKEVALKLTKELGLENNIIFQQFRLDVPDVLSAVDIFILPSLWEGLPIGLLEAMSMGKAVIATNVDGTSEIIKNHHNGLLIGLTNLKKDLSEAIITLAKDAALREKFKTNAIETVRNRFNAGIMTKQVEQIYSQAYQNKKSPNGV
jgi:glycosyltransferase involved in cell wall biosynthesis